MHDGHVRARFSDYLGQAIVIEHDRIPAVPEKAISIYAHTRPLDGILPGVNVGEGDVIACIADTGRSKTNILPRLHFSFGRPSPNRPPKRNWTTVWTMPSPDATLPTWISRNNLASGSLLKALGAMSVSSWC